ncbi:MAG: hypothetical protein WCO84_03565 [bacterium]
MSKQIFRDFISKKTNQTSQPERQNLERYENQIERDYTDKHKNKSFFSFKNLSILIILGIVFLIGFFQLSDMFSSVVIKVTPVSENIVLDEVYTAIANGSTDPDSIRYKVMKIEQSESAPISASGSEKVSTKASGEIIVYNEQSETPQKLVTGTRFESTDGKIYKIDKAISIPGSKKIDGKVIPGSLAVTVYASEPGEEYNIAVTDFTLPGLKDSPKFKTVYGRGKTEMKGGFLGERKILSAIDVSSAKKKLEESLRQNLLSKAKNQVPDGYILFDDAVLFDFKDNSEEVGKSKSEGDKLAVTVTGSLNGAIFNSVELAQFIAKQKVQDIKDYSVHLKNPGILDFKIISKDNLDLSSNKNFSFKLVGSPTLIWDFSEKDFKQNLVGLPKDKYQEIFKKYPMIEKAETVFTPSWSSYFPSNVDKISIELLNK